MGLIEAFAAACRAQGITAKVTLEVGALPAPSPAADAPASKLPSSSEQDDDELLYLSADG